MLGAIYHIKTVITNVSSGVEQKIDVGEETCIFAINITSDAFAICAKSLDVVTILLDKFNLMGLTDDKKYVLSATDSRMIKIKNNGNTSVGIKIISFGITRNSM